MIPTESKRNSSHLLLSNDRMVLSAISSTERMYYSEYQFLTRPKMDFFEVEYYLCYDEIDIRKAWKVFNLVNNDNKVVYRVRRTH